MAPKVHMKGRMLQLVAEGQKWDYELASQLTHEYELEDSAYWHDQFRLELTDLRSGGLIDADQTKDTVDADKTFGREKLIRLYSITPFGRERMRMTGLLPRETARSQEV